MQTCSGCGTKAVRGNISLLHSLAGVKGLFGCAVRQNSKSDPVQGRIVLELEGPIALLTLALVSEKVEPSSSGDDNDSSNRDPDFSSDNGDSSEAEQGRSSTRWNMV
jgi:hypothetical protein